MLAREIFERGDVRVLLIEIHVFREMQNNAREVGFDEKYASKAENGYNALKSDAS